MSVDQLGIYNDALILIGQRPLVSLTASSDDREPRRLLDALWGYNAIDYCLEVVKPVFASRTVKLNSPTASTQHTLAYTHTIPSGFVTLKGLYSDPDLDDKINRFIKEGNTLACDYATVYLRYISNTYSVSDWTPSFARVVSAYLARELATRLSPDDYPDIAKEFRTRVEDAVGLDTFNEPSDRSITPTVTLTNEWRRIYNDALLLLGLEPIASNADDSNRRVVLDRALDSKLVDSVLEDTLWLFATQSTKITYDPSAEPAWGYRRSFQKPDDIMRIDGLYYDEYLKVPLKNYMDESNRFFCDEDEIYLSYISTGFTNSPAAWTPSFTRLVAARMAKDAAPSLRNEGADPVWASEEYERRKSAALSIDAMQSPPRRLSHGNWVSSFNRGGYRGRP